MLNYKNKRQVEYGNQGRKVVKVTASCFCGVEFDVALNDLKGGQISCGCIKGEKHGMKGTRFYRIWLGMKTRTVNINNKDYKNYGGRGIKICPEWEKSFTAFYNDMKEGYLDTLSIDRIDNNGNYCKENCRWSTQEVQFRNKRNNLTFKGEYAVDANKRLGGSHSLIANRIRNGWTKEKAFTTTSRTLC